ncbi:hypothetical protein B0I35DRAFT_99228 [Stachybotrys elegans]|uniref:NACHT domain-containing protein n=1 Tax=Stachybotrys elegans TaxID=80388 RepID=A0A8K0WL73_9HYPO|nr:hypothetical protein B0I35DRAFT_99228 [Stachybotrys elegans]
MEAFAALGLASNIVQFIDFSCKLFSTAQEIHSSASGSSTRIADASTIASTLNNLSKRLLERPALIGSAGSSGDRNPSLDILANTCRDIALELMALLDQIRAQEPHSKWESFKAALRTIRHKDQIDELERRLEDYRRQILTTLEIMQSEQQSVILWKVNTLYEANSRLHADMNHQISTLQSSIMNALAKVTSELQRQDLQTVVGRKQAKTDTFFEDLYDKEPTDMQPHLRTLAIKANEGSDISVALRLLRTLRFNSMGFRYSKIPEAHLNTFQWMFNNTFARWLTSSHPVFWISGKPGSGKSTLVKFLVDNLDLTRYLGAWTNGAKVVVASYFFWVNGTETQKSQEGLLRSLLYDLLRQNPPAIKKVFPQWWQWFEAGYTDEDIPSWTRQDLIKGLTRLLHGGLTSMKYCIFIDGLDEYEGEHEDLIRVIRGFVSYNNVKLCIASRPWNVFEAAFGDDVAFKMYLEQFNRADIVLYVRDNLEHHPDFQRIRVRDSQADALLAEITSRAQGVFLWVYLVVRSLVRGLQNRDRIVDLYRRLRAFPSDLDDFFMHILMSLEETYRVQTARIFRVALAAPRPLSLLNYWYIDAEEDDPQIHLKLPVLALDAGELNARRDEMCKRLNGRCRGLLEVTRVPNADTPYEYRVDFLHRTVKDFLRTTKIQHELMRWSSHGLIRADSQLEHHSRRQQMPTGPFDPYLTLCKSTLAEIRSAPVKYGYLRGPGPMQDMVSDFFFAAQQYELSTGQSLTGLVEELDKVIRQHVVYYPTQQPFYPWINWQSQDILTHAVKWNLLLHVKQVLDPKRTSTTEKSRLLDTALTGRFGRNGELKLGPDQQMVEALLLTGPTVSFDAKQISSIVATLTSQPCQTDGLYGCIMLLAIHGSLKVSRCSDVWVQLLDVLTRPEVDALEQTQKMVARERRNPLVKWFRHKTKKLL